MSNTPHDINEAIRPCAAIDIFIILALICGAFFSFNRLGSVKPDIVVVFRQNAVIAEYPLNHNAVFKIFGQIGQLNIEIKDGTAKILHADCPRRLCKQSGAISGSYNQIICAPNNILIQIRSSKTNHDIDAVAY